MAVNSFVAQVTGHPTFSELERGISLIGQIQEALPTDSTSEQESLNRIRQAFDEAHLRIKTNASIVATQSLNRLQNSTTVITNELDACITSGDFTPLDSLAIDSVDDFIRNLTEIPPVSATNRVKRQFAEAVSQSREEFKEITVGVTDSLALLQDVQNESNAFIEGQRSTFEDELARLKDKNSLAGAMVNAVSGYALGSQYQEESNQHRESATKWTKAGYTTIGLLVIIAIAFFALQLFGVIASPDSLAGGVNRFLQQTPLLTTLGVVATLMFRRAADHRRREERATRLMHELTMLRAFIERLPEAQQIAVLTVLTPRYFIGATTEVTTPSDTSTLLDLIKANRTPDEATDNHP